MKYATLYDIVALTTNFFQLFQNLIIECGHKNLILHDPLGFSVFLR